LEGKNMRRLGVRTNPLAAIIFVIGMTLTPAIAQAEAKALGPSGWTLIAALSAVGSVAIWVGSARLLGKYAE
jgi:asparagine N-glycosylation enzyme membrane subunit Stt3